jgi:hypothetical protein
MAGSRSSCTSNGRRVVSTSIALMAAATPAGTKQGVVGDGRRQCDGDGRHHRARRRELLPQQGQVGQLAGAEDCLQLARQFAFAGAIVRQGEQADHGSKAVRGGSAASSASQLWRYASRGNNWSR